MQSPDLNPNLWNYLGYQVRKRKPLPRNKQKLIDVVRYKKNGEKISIETLHHLILSLPNQVEAVIKAKGGHTNC
jgi:hypothetical protein